MTCWDVKEGVWNLAWPTGVENSNGTNTTAEIETWWSEVRGWSPTYALCVLNQSHNCNREGRNTFNKSGLILLDIISITNREVEIKTLNLTKLRTKTAACTWIKIEETEPRTYCNWSCAQITKDYTYGYWRAHTAYPVADGPVACSTIFRTGVIWSNLRMICPASDNYIRDQYRKNNHKEHR